MRFKKGTKVTYRTPHKKEHGIVKRIADKDHVFVVYNCNDKWEKYYNYTAAKTRIKDLKVGWK